jgi:hypothetical protein
MRERRIMAWAVSGALLAAPAAIAQATASGQPIHRCIGAQGEIVFSGLACAAGTSMSASAAPTDATAPPILATDTCPTSRDELRDRITAAITRRDPNALATLLRWRGVGAGAANGRLRTLRDLVQRPLLAVDGGDIGDTATDATASAAADGLRVRTGSNESDGVREHRFGVRVDGSCYWLVW